MAGVEDPHSIDVVAELPDGSVALVITETEKWHGSDAQLGSLRAKIEGYVAAIRSGQISRSFPGSASRVHVVQVDYTTVPDGRVSDLVTEFGGVLAAESIRVVMNAL